MVGTPLWTSHKKIGGGNIGDAFGCLYSSSGPCGFVSGLAQFDGVTPYNPVVFYIGIILLVIGIILFLSIKGESASE